MVPSYSGKTAIVFRVRDRKGCWSGHSTVVTWRALNQLSKATAASLVHFLLHASQHCFETAYVELYKLGNSPVGVLNPAILELLTTINQQPFRIHALEMSSRYAGPPYTRKRETNPLPTHQALATAMQFLNFHHVSTRLSSNKELFPGLAGKPAYRTLQSQPDGERPLSVLFRKSKGYTLTTADSIVKVDLTEYLLRLLDSYQFANLRDSSPTRATWRLPSPVNF